MIKPIPFPEANKNYAIQGLEGSDLPAFQNEQVVISCWQLDDEDIEIIKETKLIWLRVYAKGQPPVMLESGIPFVSDHEFPEKIEG